METRARRKRSKPEQIIHGAVVRHLQARAVEGLDWWHTPNGGFRDVREAVKFKRLGTRPGVFDLIFLYRLPDDPPDARPMVYAMEFKAPGGRLSENQLEWRSNMDAKNVNTAVCDSIDAALRVLECWGLLRGKSA